jgi:hypothetical protein
VHGLPLSGSDSAVIYASRQDTKNPYTYRSTKTVTYSSLPGDMQIVVWLVSVAFLYFIKRGFNLQR